MKKVGRFKKAIGMVLLLQGPPLWAADPSPAPTSSLASQGLFSTFDLKSEPKPADWRYFLKASERDRQVLWTTHNQAGYDLKDWSWGWRLGWVRACSSMEKPYCRHIMEQALRDKALVVRAEAATRFGRTFEGTANPEALSLLSQSYHEARNLRHGRPLVVQQRILFAIHRIGGDEAQKLGGRLAHNHRETRAYWAKLMRSQEK